MVSPNRFRRSHVVGSALACALIVLGVTPNANASVACLVMPSKGAKTTTTANPSPRSGKMYLDDCSGLTAVEGRVDVCFEPAKRRTACSTLTPGNRFDGSTAGNNSWIPIPMMKVVELMTGRGSLTWAAGVKKANEPDRRPGFPYGVVAVNDAGITIQSSEATRFESFALMRGGNTVSWQARASTFPVTIPSAALAPGTAYQWRVRMNNQEFTGRFTTLKEDDARAIADEIAAVRANKDITEEARLFMEAIIYDDHRMILERDRALSVLR